MPLPDLSLDFRDMLGLLLKHRVEFVVIGAHALAAHGYPRSTGDMDFYVRPSPDNAKKLWQALEEFEAPLARLMPEDFQMPNRVVQIGVAPYRIDFTTFLSGIDRFEQVWANRIEVEHDGMIVPVIGKEDLLRNKRATGRAQDKIDIDLLEGRDPDRPQP